MVYQPEYLTDLETGAIIRAEVRTGDSGDSEELSDRVLEGCRALAGVCEDPKQEKVGRSLTTDEGYFSAEEVCALQSEGIRTVMGDPHESHRNKDKRCKVTRQTLNKAKRAVKSKSGKALLRKRGEHLERSFAHVLDHGGLRRAALRGKENLTKRQIAAAMTYDLSLLMRKIFGFGTPKQWTAQSVSALIWLANRLVRLFAGLLSSPLRSDSNGRCSDNLLIISRRSWIIPEIRRSSTGC
jgi:hypothetical protein